MKRRNLLRNILIFIFAFIFGYTVKKEGENMLLQRGDSALVKGKDGELIATEIKLLTDKIGDNPQSGTEKNSIWTELIRREVNPEWFGAVGDGVTDNTSAYTAALDYLSSVGGGKLLFPSGVWRGALMLGFNLNTSVMKKHDNITIEGVGKDTILTLDAGDQSLGGELIALRGQSVSKKLKGITLRNLRIKNKESNLNPGNGIGVTKTENILIENVVIENCTNYGITIESENENVTLQNVISISNAKSGIALTSSSTRRVRVINVTCEKNSEHGIYISNHSGTSIEELLIIAPICRNNLKTGIWGSHFDHSQIIGGVISNNLKEGIFLQNQKGSKLTSITVQNNGFEGIRLSNCEGTSIIGADISDNAGVGTNKVGIRIHNLSKNCMVIGSTIKNVNTSNQINAINVNADGCVFENNDLKGNGGTDVVIGTGFATRINGYYYTSDISGSVPIQDNVRKFQGASPPKSGSFKRGDIVENLSPSAGGFSGWICISDGTPGKWKGYGLIQE
ncbi:right-handed parallel beta-helix repeat-containing protein [Peribacillus asahii]|uniref:right-handed parallel beta-helix repeat-containing protein n=1 Tax=Peribacillus asahii TaxID=228899 RepID=UPI0038211B1B